MNKHLVLKLLTILGLLIIGGLLVTQSKSYADSLCGVLAPSNTDSNCTPGGSQDYSTCTVVDTASGISPGDDGDNCPNAYGNGNPGQNTTKYESELKSEFISNLEWYASHGQPPEQTGAVWIEPFEQTGAVWIENQLDGSDAAADWAARVNNPEVSLKVENFSYSLNTAYDESTGSVIQYPDSGTAMSLVMWYDGVEVFAIKLNCGNPVGSLNALPGPDVTISGLVYYHGPTGSTGIDGVPITTCVSGQSPQTTGYALYTMTIKLGTGFCIRVPNSFTASDGTVYEDPEITPDYVLPGSIPGGETGHCGADSSTYEYQSANYPKSPGLCNYGVTDAGYNIAYKVREVNISGIVYYFNGSGSVALAGVKITTCVSGQNPTTSGNPNTNANPGNGQDNGGGGYGFTVGSGTGFCVRVPDPYIAPDGTEYSNPKITPHYILPGSIPSGFANNCRGNTSSYEEQIAGNKDDAGGCDYGDMNDSGYDIAYTTITPPGLKMSGTVYYYNGSTAVAITSNITISKTCGYGTPSTGSSGSFSIPSVKPDASFCVAGLPATVSGHGGVVYTDLAIAPNYSGSGNPIKSPPASCGGNTTGYPNQKAESGSSPGCGYNVNNNGYDFVYLTKYSPPSIGITPGSAACTNGGYTASFTATDPTATATHPDPITGVTISAGSFKSAVLKATKVVNGVYYYSYDISNWEGYKTTDFTITATDKAGTANASLSAPPCFSLSCGSLSSSTGVLDESKQYTITVKTAIGGLGAAPQGSVPARPFSISSLPAIAGLPSSAAYTISPTVQGNSYTFVVTFTLPNSITGAYTVNWSLSLLGTDPTTGKIPSTGSCSSSYKVYRVPYIKVYGGDVEAGSNFVSSNSAGGGCWSTPASSGIFSSQDTSTGTYIGSSTEEGAFATALIDDFGSYNNQLPSGYTTPDVLNFANSPAGSYGFGGDLSSNYCVPDYYQQFASDSSITTKSPPSGSNTLSSAGVPSAIGIGDQYVVLSTKDLYVDHNTSFPGSVPASTATSQLPMLYVVVKGANIYIDNNVTQLAGVYVAEENSAGAGGNIYDCSTTDPQGAVVSDPFAAGVCSKQLIVDGSFLAKNIDFQRTNGNIAKAADSGASCTTPDPNSADAFCYSPLIWLANPLGGSSGPVTNSISSTPPTL